MPFEVSHLSIFVLKVFRRLPIFISNVCYIMTCDKYLTYISAVWAVVEDIFFFLSCLALNFYIVIFEIHVNTGVVPRQILYQFGVGGWCGVNQWTFLCISTIFCILQRFKITPTKLFLKYALTLGPFCYKNKSWIILDFDFMGM